MIKKFPKNYKGYEFNAPPDLGVIDTNKKVLNAFPFDSKVFYSLYENDEDFNDAVQDIKNRIDDENNINNMD